MPFRFPISPTIYHLSLSISLSLKSLLFSGVGSEKGIEPSSFFGASSVAWLGRIFEAGQMDEKHFRVRLHRMCLTQDVLTSSQLLEYALLQSPSHECPEQGRHDSISD